MVTRESNNINKYMVESLDPLESRKFSRKILWVKVVKYNSNPIAPATCFILKCGGKARYILESVNERLKV